MNSRHLSIFGGLGTTSMSPYYGRDEVAIQIGPNCEIVDRRILHTYLPRLTKYRSVDYDGTINLNRCVRTMEGVQRGHLSLPMMRKTLITLVRAMARNVADSEEPVLHLTELLEDSLLLRQRPWKTHTHGTTYQYFAALAEISQKLGSYRICSVMHTFFNKSAHRIVPYEGPSALYDWARAIMYSNMRESDMVPLLREIIVLQPEFVVDMHDIAARTRRPFAYTVSQAISDIASRLSAGSFGTIERGRGFMRGGTMIARRRSVSLERLPYRRPTMALRAASYSGGMYPVRASLSMGGGLRGDRSLMSIKRQLAQLQDRQDDIEEELGVVTGLAMANTGGAYSDFGSEYGMGLMDWD